MLRTEAMRMKRNEKTSIPAQSSPSGSRSFWGNGWITKIICLLSAFILWLYVVQVDTFEYEETFHFVDVELTEADVLESRQGLSIYGGYGNVVDVTVTGPRGVLSKISSEDIHVYADVSQISEAGMHLVSLHTEVPSGVTFQSISQNTVQVYCDEKSSTVVDVRVRITAFTMESHLEMGKLETNYDTVIVTGPKEALDEIESAVVTLELGSVTTSMTASGPLVLMDRDGNEVENPYLKMSRSEVSVTIPVTTVKTVPLCVNTKYGYLQESNSQLELNPNEIAVRGDPTLLERLDEIVVTVLDEKKIYSDITQVLPLELPDGIVSVDDIHDVTLHLTHVGTYTAVFTVTDIDVTGSGSLDYEILDKSLAVTVRGTLEELGQLRTTDFSAIVDLSGYTSDSSGTITEPVKILIDSAFAENVYEIGEYFVQVKLN